MKNWIYLRKKTLNYWMKTLIRIWMRITFSTWSNWKASSAENTQIWINRKGTICLCKPKWMWKTLKTHWSTGRSKNGLLTKTSRKKGRCLESSWRAMPTLSITSTGTAIFLKRFSFRNSKKTCEFYLLKSRGKNLFRISMTLFMSQIKIWIQAKDFKKLKSSNKRGSLKL